MSNLDTNIASGTNNKLTVRDILYKVLEEDSDEVLKIVTHYIRKYLEELVESPEYFNELEEVRTNILSLDSEIRYTQQDINSIRCDIADLVSVISELRNRLDNLESHVSDISGVVFK